MIDYYLKFPSREDAFEALKTAGYTSIDEEGNEFIVSATQEYCIDEIGVIYKTIAEDEMIQIDGWNINIRMISGDIAENLKEFLIDSPKTPYRVFA